MQFQAPLFHFLRHGLRNPLQKSCLMSTNYESSLSLKNLYPESSLSISSPPKIPQKDDVKFNGYIPIDKLNIAYSKSSGPGGQHINCVNTKVDIRFNLESASWLGEEVKKKLADMYKSRINKDGYLAVKSDRTRSQIYNQADALTILREMIYAAEKACVVLQPSRETLHLLRKRKERANILRLASKNLHSLKKMDRKIPDL